MAGVKFDPKILFAGVVLAVWWLMRDIALPNDVGWQFWIARQMLGGSTLYDQIWEINPPLWFWSAIPFQWLAERAGWDWGRVLVGAVLALSALSAWLTAHLLALPRRGARLGVMLLVFTMTVILHEGLTGQREQFALIASVPYAALLSRRRAGVPTAPLLAIAVAVLAGYGFALKHYFLAVPVLLEVWLMLHQGKSWRPWRPELVVLAVLACGYAAAVAVLMPAFFTVNLPMVEAGYFASRQTLLFTLLQPQVLLWAVAGLFLWVTRRSALRDFGAVAEFAIPALGLTWLGFAIGYVLQLRGWDYHGMAATGAIGVAVGLRGLRLYPPPFLALLAGAAWALCLADNLRPPERAAIDPYLDRVAPGEGVFIAGFDASAIFQRRREDLVWVSRSYSLWMLFAVAKAEAEGRTSPALARLEMQVLAAISQDIRCHPPQMIVMQATPGLPGRNGEFSFNSFLLRDPPLREFIAAHYSPLRQASIGTVYWRNRPVAREAGLDCRVIR